MKSNRPVLSERVIAIILQSVDSIPEISETIIFGSRALGNAKDGSDIDLCLKGKEITSRLIAKIDMSLNEETNLPYFFDIVHYEAIKNEELKKHIDQFGIVIFSRPGNVFSSG
jgi:predicted nucleotidyltransferase